MRHTLAAAAAALVLYVQSAQAADFTGNAFLELESTNPFAASAMVRGFLMGWQGSHFVSKMVLEVEPGGPSILVRHQRNDLCIPDGVTVGQATDVVVKAMREDPAKRHQDAGILMWSAIRKAWPCPK